MDQETRERLAAAAYRAFYETPAINDPALLEMVPSKWQRVADAIIAALPAAPADGGRVKEAIQRACGLLERADSLSGPSSVNRARELRRNALGTLQDALAAPTTGQEGGV